MLRQHAKAHQQDMSTQTCTTFLPLPQCCWSSHQKFKAHFISILAGVNDNFPIRLWDKLLPQAELTLNRQGNFNLKLLAYAYLFEIFDYNRLPLAPLGCAVQVHIPPKCCTSWGVHARKRWYIGCAWDHYCLHTYVNNVTKREKVSDAVDFKHKSRTNPTMTDYNKNMRAFQNLHSSANEFGRHFLGIGGSTAKPTNTCYFIDKQ